MTNEIIFIGNARDFHAIDWYRTIKKICNNKSVYFATDLINSEGHDVITDSKDSILSLFNIDNFLFKKQSRMGNVWRNFIKLFFFPIQVIKLKKIRDKHPNAIYHAHTMYYLFISWMAGIRFIGTPQGDEILVRPYKSYLYKYFAKKSLQAAQHLIVDSINLQLGILKLSGKSSEVIQYGIDTSSIYKNINDITEKKLVTSIRALYPLYRIDKIINARDQACENQPLSIFYPFWEENYKKMILNSLKPYDINLGRISEKSMMYRVLATTVLAISIPESDSSPRTVYEAIFCGCCVAVTYNPWIESLPKCMKERILIVDLKDPIWLSKAIEHAKILVQKPYIPSNQARNIFDQERSMQLVVEKYYLH